jgi:hypothetical protein
MIKNEIKLEKDFKRCIELITKIEKLEEIYKGYTAIIEDQREQSDEMLWKYNYFRGKDFNIDEIREDFAECFNDLIIDYVNEEDKKNSGE